MGALLSLFGKEIITKGNPRGLHCSEGRQPLPTSANQPFIFALFSFLVIFRSISGAWIRRKTRFHRS